MSGRYLSLSDLPKRDKGHCRWCGEKVTPPRRSWCSDNCVAEYQMRNSSPRWEVERRDKGVCALCTLDCNAMEARLHKWMHENEVWAWQGPRDFEDYTAVPLNRSLWEADHIVPVIEGGGACGLDNFRTLCPWCHKRVTADLATRRAQQRSKQAPLPLVPPSVEAPGEEGRG